MCTLTWWQDDSRYALFFNRDEQKTRLPAGPPEIQSRDGVLFIAPIDGARGGTWILANEHGLSLALLNFYAAAIDPASLPGKSPSRGHLVLSLSASRTPESVGPALAEQSLEDYWPFHLFAIAPGQAPRVWTWAGTHSALRTDFSPSPPLTTSSVRTAEVCAARIGRYRDLIATGAGPIDLHRTYHNLFEPGDPAVSVRMRRPDAQTLSYSEIQVDDDTIRFTYRPETIDSCETNPTVTREIPRLPSSS